MTHRTGSNGSTTTETEVVDFNEIREQKLEEKRRKTERIFFKQLISVYSVVSDTKMLAIDIIDLSEEGCSFQIPYDPDNRWPRDMKDIPIRLYFSQDTYLEIRAKIENSKPCIDRNARYTRFGCSVDMTLKSYPAYQQFVRFLKAYSEHAHKDMGDVSVFYL